MKTITEKILKKGKNGENIVELSLNSKDNSILVRGYFIRKKGRSFDFQEDLKKIFTEKNLDIITHYAGKGQVEIYGNLKETDNIGINEISICLKKIIDKFYYPN